MSISDKIVLMKDGHLQQVAGAQELYDDPHNEFVASFLGNPPINKVEAVVKGGKVLLGKEELDSGVKVDNVADNTKVYLSFRSESVILDNNSPLKGKVVSRAH